MNPITMRDVIAHQKYAPWGQLRQVEQDLLICRSMVAIFADSFLKAKWPCAEEHFYTRYIGRFPKSPLLIRQK